MPTVQVYSEPGNKSLCAPVSFGSPANKLFSRQIEWNFSRPVDYFSTPTSRDAHFVDITGSVMPLLPYPGSRIEQFPGQEHDTEGADAKSGTLGLYLRLRPIQELEAADILQPRLVYALTSRHVAVACRAAVTKDIHERRDSRRTDNHEYENGATALCIFSGGVRCLPLYMRFFEDTRTVMYKRYEKWLQQFYVPMQAGASQGVESERIKARHRTCIDAYMYCAKLKRIIRKLATVPDNDEVSLIGRSLGKVAYSPRHKIEAGGHFSDWALIRLDEGSSEYINKVYMASELTADICRQAKSITLDEISRNHYDHRDRLQHVDVVFDEDGIFYLHTMLLPADPFFVWTPGETRVPHLVAKRGAKTGLTFGLTNELEAVFRTPIQASTEDGHNGSGEFEVSYSLMVVGLPRKPANDSEPGGSGGSGESSESSKYGLQFSEPGDAGACVFDTAGRVVGIIEPGQYAKDVARDFDSVRAASTRTDPNYSDITFVTPIQWILEDIKQFTGMQPEILQNDIS